MQFKVPQDVQRADKIVGPLTLRQLIICGIGGGLAYSLYVTLSKQYFIEIWLIPVVLITLVTVLFAFYQYHGLPFEKLMLLFIEWKFRPRVRTFQKMKGDVLISVLSPMKMKTLAKTEILKEDTDRERLKKLHEMIAKVDMSEANVLISKN